MVIRNAHLRLMGWTTPKPTGPTPWLMLRMLFGPNKVCRASPSPIPLCAQERAPLHCAPGFSHGAGARNSAQFADSHRPLVKPAVATLSKSKLMILIDSCFWIAQLCSAIP